MGINELIDILPLGSVIEFGKGSDGTMYYYASKKEYEEDCWSYKQGLTSKFGGKHFPETFTQFIKRIIKEME